MILTRNVLIWILGTVLLTFASPASAAIFVVPTDDELIDSADAIVVATVQPGSYGAFAVNGDIMTHTRLMPSRVLKGNGIPAGKVLEIRDFGGVVGSQVMGVSGGVNYRAGERVLLFLARDDGGHWTTYGMTLGKFASATSRDGLLVMQRPGLNAGDVLGLTQDGLPHVDRPRFENQFVEYIRDRVGRTARGKWDFGQLDRAGRAANYFASAPAVDMLPEGGGGSTTLLRPQANSHFPPSSYASPPYRWARFDAGQSVPFYVTGSQPGFDSLGAAQRGLAAWTNEPNSNVNYVYAGTSTAGFVQDGQNTIVFNASSGVPAGAIGYAKWYANAQHTYKGEQFYSISEGDVVMRSGLSMTQKSFEEAVTHELGHTLGFRHSDQDTPASSAAVMNSVVTGQYGASLGPWDVEAVTHVYTASAAAPCTPPSITAHPTSQTIGSGQQTTLTVSATGTGPLTYQWYTGTSGNTGAPISGATNASLTVAPTSTASYWVRVSNACGAANSTTATLTVNTPTPPPPPAARIRGDFNGDGLTDVIWRNRRTGENRVWLMNASGQVIRSVALQPVADQSWQIGGAGDFNGDGHQDLVWRNYANGQNVVWYMSDTNVTSSGSFQTVADLNWRIESVIDFNRDGRPDLVWRNYATGANAVWTLVGTTITGAPAINSVGDPAWKIAGAGDTNADGNPDLMWRNTRTGQNAIWFMNGTSLVHTTAMQTVADANWDLAAVASFNGDINADALWRNYATGEVAVWLVHGGFVASAMYLPSETNPDWRVVGPR